MGTGPQAINVDDSDVDDIEYTPADLWNHRDNQPSLQDGTYTQGLTGAHARFAFNGTRVMVYGVALPKPPSDTSVVPPSVVFALDDGRPTTVVSKPDLREPEYAHQFFDSQELEPGEHVLQMDLIYAARDWPFILDYIHYVPLPDPPAEVPTTTVSSDPGPTTTATSSSSGSGAASSSTAGASSAQSDTEEGTTWSPMTIVAAAVAGAVLLLVIAGLVRYRGFFKRWRRNRQWKGGPNHYSGSKRDLLNPDLPPPPSPYLLGVPPSAPPSDAGSAYGHGADGMSTYSRTHSVGTGYLLYANSAHGSVLNLPHHPPPFTDVDSRPSTRPPSPSHTAFTGSDMYSNSGYQRSVAQYTDPSFIMRTPSSLDFHRPASGIPPSTYSGYPPDMLHPPSIMHRPSTPSGSSIASSARTGSTSKARLAGLDAADRPATFHMDSGVRFRAGDALPAEPGASGLQLSHYPPHHHPLAEQVAAREWEEQARAQEEERERERLRQKLQRVSYGGSAISDVPPLYTPN